MKSLGDKIIDAVIRAKAIDMALVNEEVTIFVWAANASEQIEAALEEIEAEERNGAV